MQWGIRIAGMNLTELERIIHTARTVLDAGGGGATRIESAMRPSRQRRKPGPWWAAESSAAKRHAVPSQSGQDGTHKRLRPRALTQDEKDRAIWELWERARAIDIEVVHDVLEQERWSLEGAEQKLRQLGFSPGAAEGGGATLALGPNGHARMATPPSMVIPQSDQRCAPPEQLYRGRTQKPWLCETCNEKEHLCPGPPRAFK